MNSKLIRENLNVFFAALDQESKETLVKKGLLFQKAVQCGDGEAYRREYAAFSDAVRNAENKAGIRIIESPDGGCVAALTALSGAFYKEAEAKRPEKGTVSFRSVREADEWLMGHPNVVPNRLSVQTDTRFGILANHAQASSITIDYTDMKKTNGYVYGMCEEEMTSYFVKGNTEEQKRHWTETHPGLEPVLMCWSSNSRGPIGAVVFGIGVIENKHLFIVYRLTKAESDRRMAAAGVKSSSEQPQSAQPKSPENRPPKALQPAKAFAAKPGIAYCMHCGKRLEAGASFCTKCGAHI